MDYWMLWTYLAGYVWFWRYHVGYVLDDFAYGDADGFDIAMSMALGTLICAFWPATVAMRGVYVLWVKYGSDQAKAIEGLFPGPKEIESRWEKKERLEREARVLASTRQREINDKERELGMELTRW